MTARPAGWERSRSSLPRGCFLLKLPQRVDRVLGRANGWGIAYAAAWTAAVASFFLLYLPLQRDAAIRGVKNQLQGRAELRAAVVNRWATERFQDANVIAQIGSVRKLLAQDAGATERSSGSDASTDARIDMSAVVTGQHELRAFVLDTRAAVAASSQEDATVFEAERQTAEHTLRDGQPRALFLQYPTGTVAVAFVVPIRHEEGRGMAGTVVIEADPDQWLYPLIEFGGAGYGSSEVVLVGAVDDAIENLTPLRKTRQAPLTRRRPKQEQVETPAYAAIEHGKTFGRFRDYAGDLVYAATERIPATGWGLVLKMDEAEVLGPFRRDMWRDGAIGTVALLLLWAIVNAARRRVKRRSELLVARSHARLVTLVNNANDPLLSLDLDGRIQFANRRAEEFYGTGQGGLLGRSASTLDAPDSTGEEGTHLRRVRDEGELVFEAVHLAAGGEPVPVEISSRRVALPEGDQIVSVVRDIRDWKAAEARIARLNTLLRTLSEVEAAVVRETDTDRLLAEACRILVEHGGFVAAWVGVPEPDHTIRFLATAGRDEGYAVSSRPRWDDTPEGRGVAGTAVREKRIVVNDDYASPAMAPWREAALARGFRSSAACPILKADAVTGLLNIYADVPRAFDDEVTELLSKLAAELGFALTASADHKARQQAEDTQRRIEERAKADLREREERFQSVYENSLIGILLAVADGPVTAANPAACAMFERTEEEMHALQRADLADMTDPRMETLLAGLKQTGRAREEVTLLRRNGAKFPAEVSCSAFVDSSGVRRTSMMIVDLSERERTAQALVTKDYAIEGSLNAVALGSLDGALTYVNPAFLRLWGFERTSEALGRSLLEFWMDPDRVAAEVLAAIQKTGQWNGELTARRQDGTSVDVRVSASRVIGPKGEPICLLGTFMDITEQKAAERRTAEQLAELRRWHDATLGREGRVLEVKAEVNALLAELGRPPRYASVGTPDALPTANSEVPANARRSL